MRLDRFLVLRGVGSRKIVHQIVKKGNVSVNDKIIKDVKYKISINDLIRHLDLNFKYEEYKYFILNKPNGVVSATKDNLHKTVIQLLSSEDYQTDIFPVGRLDIDTTGFLLLTNDGELAHRMLSPKHHVDKTYEVDIQSELTEIDIYKLTNGVKILNDYTTLKAKVKVIDKLKIHLTISEGKYHQVKEMLKAVDNKVVKLKRISFGEVMLPENLKEGEYIKVDFDVFKNK